MRPPAAYEKDLSHWLFCEIKARRMLERLSVLFRPHKRFPSVL